MQAHQAMHTSPKFDLSESRIAQLERTVAALRRVQTLREIVSRVRGTTAHAAYTAELREAEAALIKLDAAQELRS